MYTGLLVSRIRRVLTVGVRIFASKTLRRKLRIAFNTDHESDLTCNTVLHELNTTQNGVQHNSCKPQNFAKS